MSGRCVNHQHTMTYATDHGGYWYCDIGGKPNWAVAEEHTHGPACLVQIGHCPDHVHPDAPIVIRTDADRDFWIQAERESDV